MKSLFPTIRLLGFVRLARLKYASFTPVDINGSSNQKYSILSAFDKGAHFVFHKLQTQI